MRGLHHWVMAATWQETYFLSQGRWWSFKWPTEDQFSKIKDRVHDILIRKHLPAEVKLHFITSQSSEDPKGKGIPKASVCLSRVLLRLSYFYVSWKVMQVIGYSAQK